jgi:acyl-CoA thioesterase
VPGSWRQGRTLYGGLNAALAARAARLGGSDPGPLRALQIAFLAPPTDAVRYVPSLLRAGRSVTFVGVDCLSGSALCARAILTYGRARDSDLTHTRLLSPDAPAPEACPVVPIDPERAPAFLAYMELRFAGGTPPMSGGDPEFAMWVRHRDPAGLDGESALLAVADVLPPAVLGSRTEFRPSSSVTWGIDLAAVPADPGGWYLLHTASDYAADGYSLQAMACFGPDGRVAAVSRQTVASF